MANVGDSVSWNMDGVKWTGKIESMKPYCCDETCDGKLCWVLVTAIDSEMVGNIKTSVFLAVLPDYKFEVCSTSFDS